MDNNLLTLLPLLMGQKGDNAQLMKTILSMSGTQNNNSMANMMASMVGKEDENKNQNNMQMMSIIANMMSNNKGEQKNNEYVGGGNAQLMSMLMNMMNANGAQQTKQKQVSLEDISDIKAIAGQEIIEKMVLVINNNLSKA